MQDRVIYEFAIIRFVPKVEREEFINIGVLLFSKRKKFLGIKYAINEKRLEAFATNFSTQNLEEYLKAWETICIGESTQSPICAMELSDRFRWLAAAKSTILQCSKTHTGLCHSPQMELDGLFERFITI